MSNREPPKTVWAVTRFEPGSTEGITVIELFDTEDSATAFRDGYVARAGDRWRMYGVTKMKVWVSPPVGVGGL